MPELRSPTQCHFWKLDNPTPQRNETENLQTYEDESHFFRALLRCRDCGQLYFYEWYEETDWESGDDFSYQTWVPVDQKDVDDLKKTDIWTIHQYTPRFIKDYRRDGSTKIGWIR